MTNVLSLVWWESHFLKLEFDEKYGSRKSENYRLREHVVSFKGRDRERGRDREKEREREREKTQKQVITVYSNGHPVSYIPRTLYKRARSNRFDLFRFRLNKILHRIFINLRISFFYFTAFLSLFFFFFITFDCSW